VENFLHIASLRIKARHKEIKALRRKNKELEILFNSPLPADFDPRDHILQLKKVNPCTLSLRLEASASLQNLETILDII
jgi:transcription-repair coupling factor (superfamily II helicase)